MCLIQNPLNHRKLLEMVNSYFDKGFRPIPVYHPLEGCQCLYKEKEDNCGDQCLGKVPKDRGWADKLYSPDDFKEKCNVALGMGKQPNGEWLIAIDIDGFLPWWWFDEMPLTLTSYTGRGIHYIFSVPPDSPFGNWTDIFHTRSKLTGYRLDHKGAIDIRYCRGAIIAPPSLHKYGRLYRWDRFITPTKLPEVYIRDIINAHAKRRPNVKRYYKWSSWPEHKNKNP